MRAVVVVLDRHLQQLLARGAELVHVPRGEHGVVAGEGGAEDRLPLHLADPAHQGQDLGGAQLGHLLAADHRHDVVQAGLDRHPGGADRRAARGAGHLGQPGRLGVEVQVLLDHPGHRALLVVLGNGGDDRGVQILARRCPASCMAARKASKASSCTVASLRRPKTPWPIPMTPTRGMNSSGSLSDVLPAVDLDHLAGDVPRRGPSRGRRPGGPRPPGWRSGPASVSSSAAFWNSGGMLLHHVGHHHARARPR